MPRQKPKTPTVKSVKNKEQSVKREKPKTPETPAGDAGWEKGKKTFSVLRGFHDILPREERYWKAIYHRVEALADFFQFGRIETPVLEEASLFVRSIGKGTDVVDKEMYTFEDRDGTKVCLRPEGTAAIARAYIGHGLWNESQPVKMWYWGQMFRHDRPQAGRYREFHQASFETVGSNDPIADAELMVVAYDLFQDLGLPVEVHVNSIGTPTDRERYREELVTYYRSKRSYLCEECKKRLLKNPLRLLDCKEAQCQPVKEDAPQIIEWLGEESKKHFTKVLEYLDDMAIPYVLDHTLVRGLDYYTNTVFEFYSTAQENETAQSALGGGGRYDLLVEMMGGKPTPAAGFSIGVERVVAALKVAREKNELKIPLSEPCNVFFAQLGDKARSVALQMVNQLRDSGLNIAFNFFKTSLKVQLEIANNLKAPYALILGQKEVQDGTVIIRDMESGIQEIVDQKKVVPVLKRKLEKEIAVG